jgi:hypothetical protein
LAISTQKEDNEMEEIKGKREGRIRVTDEGKRNNYALKISVL